MARIDPHLPVKELLARMPQIRPVLAVYGIDTCCGGEHALVEACRGRGRAVRAPGHGSCRFSAIPPGCFVLSVADTPHVLGAAGDAWAYFLGGPVAAPSLAGAGLLLWIVLALTVARTLILRRDL